MLACGDKRETAKQTQNKIKAFKRLDLIFITAEDPKKVEISFSFFVFIFLFTYFFYFVYLPLRYTDNNRVILLYP